MFCVVGALESSVDVSRKGWWAGNMDLSLRMGLRLSPGGLVERSPSIQVIPDPRPELLRAFSCDGEGEARRKNEVRAPAARF